MASTVVGAQWRLLGLRFFLGSASAGSPAARSFLSTVLIAVLALIVFAMIVAMLFGQDAGAVVMAIAGPAAAPAANRPTVAWGRKREPMKTFNNVGAGNTAYTKIPRYARTVLGFLLQRGGTTFTAAHMTRIELFLGEKSIWGPVTGTDLDMIARYVGENDRLGNDSYWVPIDFTLPNVKEIGAEQIGGIDLTTLPDGELRLEVDVSSSASSPTLRGEVIWGPPQGGADLGNLMLKLIKRTYPTAAAGDFYPDINVRGAIIVRQFFKGTVMNAGVATAGAFGTNTGNGTMGAITVSALTPVGRYSLVITAGATNAGAFSVFAPNYLGGYLVGTGNVASAFSKGGLAFTLADGATDFVAGDNFAIDVLPNNTDGNVNLIEVKKNEEFWWLRRSSAARLEQIRYGRTPMAGLEVVDWVLDNHGDSVIDTADAAALDYRLNLTAQDTLTVIHQVLAQPTYNT